MFVIIFVLSGIGITNLLVNASILDTPRYYLSSKSVLVEKLLSCMMCLGFWVGFIFAIPFGLNPIMFGATISLLSNFYSLIAEYVEISTSIKAIGLSDDM